MSQIDSQLGKVAVLLGGQSAEREVSLMSGQGVLQALRSRGVDAYAFDPSERELGELKREKFTRCFIALHGRFGEDGTVQGALELMGIPYTGSGVMASSIAIDKVMTKRVWLAEELPTPRYILLRRGAFDRRQVMTVPDQLGLPLIVKPAREGIGPGLARGAHRGGRRQLRLPEQVLHRHHPVSRALRFAGGRGRGHSGHGAQGLPCARLQGLGTD